MIRDGVITFTRMPFIDLGVGHMGLKHKAFVFLWSLLLVCGPNLDMLRWKLGCVAVFCTDRGIECGLNDLRDLLPDFLSAIGSPVTCMRETFLFPNAVDAWVASPLGRNYLTVSV